MSDFRKRLREFAAEQIAQPGEHKRAEIAAQFLDDNPELARAYVRELAERQIATLIKDLCDEPDGHALTLFNGLPTAITVAPGVVKATTNCDLNDLGAGLTFRRENVRNATDRLNRYIESMNRYESLRKSEEETVGAVTERLRAGGAK